MISAAIAHCRRRSVRPLLLGNGVDVLVEERTSFSFGDPSSFKLRTYLGKLVKGKLAAERRSARRGCSG
jgi:hypothetical protein